MRNQRRFRDRLVVLWAFLFLVVTAAGQADRTAQKRAEQAAIEQGNHLFQSAESAWEQQKWEPAIARYRQLVTQFPSHPEIAEAHFKIGYYLSFMTAPEEAIAEYEKAIAKAPGTHEAHESKLGIAALKYYLRDYQGAYDLFREVVKETQDWSLIKECTLQMKEIGRMIALQKLPNERSALDCGPKAFQLALEKRRLHAPENELKKLLASTGGTSLEQLKEAAQAAGLPAWGIKLKAKQLGQVQTPFISHIGNNHYVVVTKVSKGRVKYLDPHLGETYRTIERLKRVWQGNVLIFAKAVPAKMRAQLLTKAEMEGIRGGHHLHGRNLGDEDDNPASKFYEDPSTNPCGGPGLPSLLVNYSNYNLLIRDTDFSYSGRGPRVKLTRTYNADDGTESAFGRSWTFNYNLYLNVVPNGVDIKRESGKVDNFTDRGDGTFDPPQWVHDQLFRNADGTYRLELKRSKLVQYFNTQGKLARIVDRNGNAVTLQYDGNNRLVSVTDAVGRINRFTYNANGKITEVIDPLNRKATFSYDSDNNLVSTVDMAGNVVSYTYNSVSFMTSVTTPKGTTRIVNGNTPHFSEFPYVVKDVIDPLGNTTHFDTGDFIAWIVDPKGNQTFIFNDARAQTTEIEDPLRNKTRRTFSSVGDLTSITDANGHSITLDYDERGNVTKITDPLGNKVELRYDNQDNLTQLVDPLGRTYRYEYDAKSNLLRVKDPTNTADPTKGITEFTYDNFGQLTSLTDARGSQTTFSYNNQGNVMSVRNPVGGMTAYSYDGIGRLSQLTDPKGNTFRYSYDGIDRLTQILQPGGATTTYNYACCTLTSITDPGGTLSFEYDVANRLTRFTNASNQVIQYGYDRNGNLTSLTYPDGKVVQYEYDVVNRMKKVTDWLNNTTTYNYDAAGNLLSSSNSNNTVAKYQYDDGNRLTSLINAKSNGAVISSNQYTFNESGQRAKIESFEPVSPTLTAKSISSTYDADNRLLTNGGLAFTHDDNGNLTTISGANSTSYSYDVFDRLTRLTSSSSNTKYQYDALGNRSARTVNEGTTKYIIDPLRSLSQVLAETDNAGNVTTYYVYGLGLTSKVTPTGQAYFYHYDNIGSTKAMTDASSNVVNKYAYDPFGNLSDSSMEEVTNSYRYTGRYGVMDEKNGLFYMRARFYSPIIGRFITKDPIGLTSSSSIYSYVNNDPTDLIDPVGLIKLVGNESKIPEIISNIALNFLPDNFIDPDWNNPNPRNWKYRKEFKFDIGEDDSVLYEELSKRVNAYNREYNIEKTLYEVQKPYTYKLLLNFCPY